MKKLVKAKETRGSARNNSNMTTELEGWGVEDKE